jgi:capsular exopolysaccharide synthesis family protein
MMGTNIRGFMEHETGINYTRQLKAIWRFKWMILLAVIIAGGVTLKYSGNRPVVYQATSTIMIENSQSQDSLAFDLGFVNIQDFGSQIAIIRSDKVLERAISQLEPEKSTDPAYMESELGELNNNLKVLQVGSTNLLTITVSSDNPTKAKEQADAITESYIYETGISKTATLNKAMERTTEQIKNLSSSEIDITMSPAFSRFTVQLKNIKSALEQVSKELTQLLAITSSNNAISMSKLKNQILIESVRIGRVIELAGQISSGVDTIDIIDDQVGIFSERIQDIANQLDTLTVSGNTSAFFTELQSGKNIVSKASDIAANMRTQLATIKQLPKPENLPPGYNLGSLYEEGQTAIIQEAMTVGISLEMVQDIIPDTSNMTMQLNLVNQKITSVISSVQDLSDKLQMTDINQGILFSYTELAELEYQVKLVAASILSMYQQVSGFSLEQIDTQVYQTLLNIEDSVLIAYSASSDLPDTISYFTGIGGNGQSYTILTDLQQQLNLAILTNKDEISVIEPASIIEPDTSFFNRYRNVGLAVFAVFFLCIFSVLVMQYLDRKVRDSAQMAGVVDTPMLAQISITSNKKTNSNPSLSIKSEPTLLEDFRTLRTNLGLDQTKGKVLLVSSSGKGEGKTLITANLARAVALQKRKVLLVDGNLRNPDISAVFGIEASKGLIEYLKGTENLPSYITKVDDIDILTVKSSIEESAELLSSPRMKTLIEDARQKYDVVIIDSNPVLPYADTTILAKMVDEVLLIVKQDISRIDLIVKSKQTLHSLGVNISGIIFIKGKKGKMLGNL